MGGVITWEVRLDRDAWLVGEMAEISVIVDNRDSSQIVHICPVEGKSRVQCNKGHGSVGGSVYGGGDQRDSSR